MKIRSEELEFDIKMSIKELELIKKSLELKPFRIELIPDIINTISSSIEHKKELLDKIK